MTFAAMVNAILVVTIWGNTICAQMTDSFLNSAHRVNDLITPMLITVQGLKLATFGAFASVAGLSPRSWRGAQDREATHVSVAEFVDMETLKDLQFEEMLLNSFILITIARAEFSTWMPYSLSFASVLLTLRPGASS